MQSLDDTVLQKRKRAIDVSKNATRQSFEILKAPIEIKKKRSIIGSYIGISLIVIGGISYLFKIYSLANQILILRIVSLGVNLSILSYLNKKRCNKN